MTASVRLWDPLLRLCHWSLALVFFADYFFNEAGDDWHQWLGYYGGACLVLRIAWGFVGPRSARWTDFWPTPTRLKVHALALWRGERFHRMGHTPIGALVMVLMMTGIASLGVTGWMMLEVDALWGAEWLETLHSWLADAVLALVGVHLLAALVESVRLRENLPLSMVTGRRRSPEDP
ncbi:cytochrome b/b6 domain-containing protein [Pseudomonas sp. EMN2]|uniref:cytochrome b/b6 domain-containing protein n=1 Tax=Pseudomonas sp. EMN2 TaxID=2615212 RepID=UPI00129C0861|nr:cytochrome b/b6 domain-containing protein [Pseudomonas sp. EMN2]